MPLDDRNYMKQAPPPQRRFWSGGSAGSFLMNPVFIIILLNIIVYIGTIINADKIALNFGLIPAEFTQHPWTIITNMFVHVGFWHIFGNMLVLFFFGRVVHKLVGTGWFLLIYFIGGIAGNALYIWLGEPVSLAIGASGAVFALTGTLVVMMPKMKVYIWGILPMPLWAYAIIFMGLWSIPNFIPGIAWQGHLGGLVVGLIAGFFFRRRTRFIYYR
jgi:membrane associated rhomboid family serine protease